MRTPSLDPLPKAIGLIVALIGLLALMAMPVVAASPKSRHLPQHRQRDQSAPRSAWRWNSGASCAPRYRLIGDAADGSLSARRHNDDS